MNHCTGVASRSVARSYDLAMLACRMSSRVRMMSHDSDDVHARVLCLRTRKAACQQNVHPSETELLQRRSRADARQLLARMVNHNRYSGFLV